MSTCRAFARLAWPRHRGDQALCLASLGLSVAGKALLNRPPQLLAEAMKRSDHDNCTKDDAKMVSGLLTKALTYQLGASLCEQTRHFLFAPVMQRASYDIARDTFEAVHSVPLAELQNMRLGDIVKVQQRGIKSVQNLTNAIFCRAIPLTMQYLFVLRALGKRHFHPSIPISAFGLLGYIGFTAKLSHRRALWRRDASNCENKVTTSFLDSLNNADTVRWFGIRDIITERYSELYHKYEVSQTRVSTSLAALNFGQAVIFNTVMMGSLVALTRSGRLADLFQTYSLIGQMAGPLDHTGVIHREIVNSIADFVELNKLLSGSLTRPKSTLKSKLSKEDSRRVELLLSEPREIEFRNVSFSYKRKDGSDSQHVLEDFNLLLSPRQSLGIVGMSGAGKSTVLKLLYRIIEPDEGSVFVGGVDIAELPLYQWRRYLGVVPQDVSLFHDTVRFNITLGSEYSEEEIHAALKASSLTALVERLPEGLDTDAGERGFSFSGGERQRMALTRCFLRQPKVLVLDEATSSLDNHTEAEILDLVFKNTGLSKIIVAHKLSAVANCEKIIYLSGGKVTDTGTHKELLKEKGDYNSMWHHQLSVKE